MIINIQLSFLDFELLILYIYFSYSLELFLLGI